MSIKNAIALTNLVLVLALGLYVIMNKPKQKSGYVLNQKLFEGFVGKVELEKKLMQLRTENKKRMDSLSHLLQSKSNDQVLVEQYSETLSNYQLAEKQVSDQYTADIWKRLNQYIAEFGKENGYDFIFGASGDGSLMYARQSNDVTEAAIKFVNARYEKGE